MTVSMSMNVLDLEKRSAFSFGVILDIYRCIQHPDRHYLGLLLWGGAAVFHSIKELSFRMELHRPQNKSDLCWSGADQLCIAVKHFEHIQFLCRMSSPCGTTKVLRWIFEHVPSVGRRIIATIAT